MSHEWPKGFDALVRWFLRGIALEVYRQRVVDQFSSSENGVLCLITCKKYSVSTSRQRVKKKSNNHS